MRFHVNPLGDVHPCTAEKKCRFGLAASDHHSTPEAAREAYEAEMSKISVLSGLKRQAFSDRDRAARGENNTVGHQLTTQFGAEELERVAEERTESRRVGIGTMDQNMGPRVWGMTYGGDFKAEEESGQGELASFLGEGKDQASHVSMIETEAGSALVILNPKASFGRLSEGSVRNSIEDAVKRAKAGEPNVGQFQNGKALVIITEEPVRRAMAEKLVEAAEANSLRIGSSSNPFSRGTMFYDERDLSVGTHRETQKAKVWAKQELEKVEPIKDKFKAKGQTIYALTNPTLGFTSLVGGRDTDPNETYYWLNSGSVPALGNKQAFGWYNRQELEAFAAGDWELARRDRDA